VFVFNEECLEAFNTLKAKLVSAPMITAPDWGQEFELMCNVSDYVVGGCCAGTAEGQNVSYHLLC